MTYARRASSLVVLLLVLAAARGQGISVEVTTIQAAEGFTHEEAFEGDLDGDGLRDLLFLAVSRQGAPSRFLRAHLRRKEGQPFRSTPDFETRLTPDVVGVSLLDVDAEPGEEIVLFNRRAAYALKPRLEGEDRVRKLLDGSFLWQFPDDDELIPWAPSVRDLDGDGLDDLVVPEPGALLVARQVRDAAGRGTFPSSVRIRVPRDQSLRDLQSRGAFDLRGRTARGRIVVSIGVGGAEDAEVAAPLLTISESLPVPQFVDWNADGRPDVLIRTAETLHVWVQGPAGFPPAPTASYPVPVVADRELMLDVSHSAHVTDLNGDRRADCVFIAGNPRAEKIRAQVLVYVQGSKGRGPAATTEEAPLFGPRGIPFQLIGLSGFVAVPGFTDVDEDGYPDLSLATFEPDLIDAIRSSGGNLDLGFSVFMNEGGTLASRASLQTTLTLRARSIERGREFLQARFVADLDGNRLRDLLVQDDPQHVGIFPLLRPGGRLALGKEPLWSLTLPSEAKLYFVTESRARGSELFFLGRRDSIHVRFP